MISPPNLTVYAISLVLPEVPEGDRRSALFQHWALAWRVIVAGVVAGTWLSVRHVARRRRISLG